MRLSTMKRTQENACHAGVLFAKYADITLAAFFARADAVKTELRRDIDYFLHGICLEEN